MSWNIAAIQAVFAEAALDCSKWNAAMDAAAAGTGSVGAVLLPLSGQPARVLPFSESIGTLVEAYIDEGWIDRDIRYATRDKIVRGGVASDTDFITHDEMKRHAYYQDFLGRQKLRWFAGVRALAGKDVWCLSLQRSIEQGPFSADEQARIVQISACLSSATTIAHALGFARQEGALRAFEISDTAAALLNRAGEVVKINEPARDLLNRDVFIRNNRICSFSQSATAALDRTLQALLRSDAGGAVMPGVCLPRADNSAPLIAYALRVSRPSAELFGDNHVIVTFDDLGKRPRATQDVLKCAFGLTNAEARLASKLAVGASLGQIADELAITSETARSQLKAVLAKTDTHRQAELVALISAIRPPLQKSE